ncbi:MAG: hypothetical protein WDW36_004931 [Sanguina aurantia]
MGMQAGVFNPNAPPVSHSPVLPASRGDFGRLGHGDTNDVFNPRPIAFFSGMRIALVACGDTHTLACTDAGVLYSFGRNQAGQLGLGHTNDVLLPSRVGHHLQSEHVSCVSCGSEHSIVSLRSGKVYSWGWGGYGNLGDGSIEDRHTPTKVIGLEGQNIVNVRCGWRHSIVVTEDGRMYTFGWGKYGQCGHGEASDQAVPRMVEALEGVQVSAVAGGWRHTLAGDKHGNLYAWGWNKFGQLGLGDTEDRRLPTLVTTLREAVRILACGWRHTVAVTVTGQVYSWGRGVNGQLGHGREEDLALPTLLSSLSRGLLQREALLAASPSSCAHTASEDRYAVVPGGEPDTRVPPTHGAQPRHSLASPTGRDGHPPRPHTRHGDSHGSCLSPDGSTEWVGADGVRAPAEAGRDDQKLRQSLCDALSVPDIIQDGGGGGSGGLHGEVRKGGEPHSAKKKPRMSVSW